VAVQISRWELPPGDKGELTLASLSNASVRTAVYSVKDLEVMDSHSLAHARTLTDLDLTLPPNFGCVSISRVVIHVFMVTINMVRCLGKNNGVHSTSLLARGI